MIKIILLLFPSVPGSLKEASEPLSKGKYCCSQAYRKHQVINPAGFELTSMKYFEICQNSWNRNFTTPKPYEVISVTALQSKPVTAGNHALKVSVPLTGHSKETEKMSYQNWPLSNISFPNDHVYTDSPVAFSGHIVLHSSLSPCIRLLGKRAERKHQDHHPVKLPASTQAGLEHTISFIQMDCTWTGCIREQ